MVRSDSCVESHHESVSTHKHTHTRGYTAIHLQPLLHTNFNTLYAHFGTLPYLDMSLDTCTRYRAK